MAEENSSEQIPESSMKLSPAEKIGVTRKEIQIRLPAGKRNASKSGINPLSHTFNRAAINFAGEQLRSDLNSETDSLTGLKNRKGWESELKKKANIAGRTKSPVVIIYLDANGLKKINDEIGHEQGSQYLKDISQILQSGTREQTDIVSRWGGDEFGVLLLATTLEGAKAWWNKISLKFKQKNISIGAGAAEINPIDLQDHTKISKVIIQKQKSADRALYIAKPKSKLYNSCVMITEQDL